MSKYVIGVDYGTLSARAGLFDISNGNEVCSFVSEYKHQVIDNYLNEKIKLGIDYALQNPKDYEDSLVECINYIVDKSNINIDDILAIGIDFTASSVVPIDEDLKPLCYNNEFKDNPHAYVKLWKHHNAQKYADEINKLANDTNQDWIKNYGGKLSSEWLIPKIYQIYKEDKKIYNSMKYFIECGDYIVWTLTSNKISSACQAGYKACFDDESGYPPDNFFEKLDKEFSKTLKSKLSFDIRPVGTNAGYLNDVWSKKLKLSKNTIVSTAIIDAHVFAPALNIIRENEMFAIIGTSTCHILLSKEKKQIPGISGVVKDGVIKGYYAYEAGQSSVGDMFAYFVKNYVNDEYIKNSNKNNTDIIEYLTNLSNNIKAGQNGLIILDWLNGNRTPYNNSSLSGVIVGIDSNTKPEDIFRALLESTAYGTKKIIKTFEKGGIQIDKFYATGGISLKNELMMQIYADVLNMDINVCDANQGGALGSAILATVALGNKNGGYDDIQTACKYMSRKIKKVYKPISENVDIYQSLYEKYDILSEFFSENENFMIDLKNIKNI